MINNKRVEKVICLFQLITENSKRIIMKKLFLAVVFAAFLFGGYGVSESVALDNQETIVLADKDNTPDKDKDKDKDKDCKKECDKKSAAKKDCGDKKVSAKKNCGDKKVTAKKKACCDKKDGDKI